MKKFIPLIVAVVLAPPVLAKLVVIVPPDIKKQVEQKIDYLKEIFEKLSGIDAKLVALSNKVDSLPTAPTATTIYLHPDKITYRVANYSTSGSFSERAKTPIQSRRVSIAPTNPWQVFDANSGQYVDRKSLYGY